MMDCKKALVEAEGDFDFAVEILRKKGQKVAANRADRESSEGAVIARVNDEATVGVIVSVNCETDFVAKNESYVSLANQLADVALGHDSLDSFLAADFIGMSNPLSFCNLTKDEGVNQFALELYDKNYKMAGTLNIQT